MKKIFFTLFVPMIVFLTFGSLGAHALAESSPLSVQFVPNPLFSESNFLPSDETSGTVIVVNNSGSAQTLQTEAIHIFDADGFGSALHLNISDGSGTLFDDSLAKFFTSSGEFSLGSLANGETKTFTYTISFINASDNTFQGKTLGFDVCVGFAGGTARCGTSVVGNEQGGIGGAGGETIPRAAGSGGIGGSALVLSVSNEHVEEEQMETKSALVTWETNFYATSQVIYGPASGAPYSLQLDALPNLGYPLGSIEDPTKVLHHAVLLTGLMQGETYVFRVVSRASPPTVSAERRFTFVSGIAAAGTENEYSPEVMGGTVRIESGEETDIQLGSDLEQDMPALQFAAALSGLPPEFVGIFELFGPALLLIAVLTIVIWCIRRRHLH